MGRAENILIIKDRLDTLYDLVGTKEYKKRTTQDEIKLLEKALGDAPAVGSGGRYA